MEADLADPFGYFHHLRHNQHLTNTVEVVYIVILLRDIVVRSVGLLKNTICTSNFILMTKQSNDVVNFYQGLTRGHF